MRKGEPTARFAAKLPPAFVSVSPAASTKGSYAAGEPGVLTEPLPEHMALIDDLGHGGFVPMAVPQRAVGCESACHRFLRIGLAQWAKSRPAILTVGVKASLPSAGLGGCRAAH